MRNLQQCLREAKKRAIYSGARRADAGALPMRLLNSRALSCALRCLLPGEKGISEWCFPDTVIVKPL